MRMPRKTRMSQRKKRQSLWQPVQGKIVTGVTRGGRPRNTKKERLTTARGKTRVGERIRTLIGELELNYNFVVSREPGFITLRDPFSDIGITIKTSYVGTKFEPALARQLENLIRNSKKVGRGIPEKKRSSVR